MLDYGFIRETYLPDVDFLTAQYPEYSQWDRGPGGRLAQPAPVMPPARGRTACALPASA